MPTLELAFHGLSWPVPQRGLPRRRFQVAPPISTASHGLGSATQKCRTVLPRPLRWLSDLVTPPCSTSGSHVLPSVQSASLWAFMASTTAQRQRDLQQLHLRFQRQFQRQCVLVSHTLKRCCPDNFACLPPLPSNLVLLGKSCLLVEQDACQHRNWHTSSESCPRGRHGKCFPRYRKTRS